MDLSRGLGDVYKRQILGFLAEFCPVRILGLLTNASVVPKKSLVIR
jgi:hypothetical protein